MNILKVHIKTLDSQDLILEFPSSSTIRTVKEKIMNELNIPSEKQFLLFNGKCLANVYKTLSDYKVQDNSTILLRAPSKESNDSRASNDSKSNEIPIYNPKLSLLPNIICCVDYDCNIDEKLYDNLKEELSEIIDIENFSILELRKGSNIMKIALIGDLALKGIKASELNKTPKEINHILKKIESKKFVCLGNNYPSDTSYKIPNYSQNENRVKLVNFLKEIAKNNEDILQISSTMTSKEFYSILEKCMKNISDVVVTQEINQKKFILNKFEEFNKKFESILKQSKKESIFEFGVAGLSLINRDISKYQNCKSKCKNLVTKFLFHGTSTDRSTLIITSNFRKADTCFFGPGIYMTDILDYAGFYAFNPDDNSDKFENHQRIRKIGETFTIVASQIFYDNLKFENCYDKTDESVPQEGIRYVRVDAEGQPLSKDQTKENGFDEFIGTEYVIPCENQILPLYSITLKRNEYYCLWKDYHFTHETEYTEHAKHVINIAKQLLGINIYEVGEFEDALDIIKRKKYNKVILISNVGIVDKTKQFIEDIRKILKFKVIILFFTASISHLEWIKDIPNALFTMDDSHFKEYILNFNETGLNNLKVKIEEEYGKKLDKFNADLSYPLFEEAKSKGDYHLIKID